MMALMSVELQLVMEPMVREASLHGVPGVAPEACPLLHPGWTA